VFLTNGSMVISDEILDTSKLKRQRPFKLIPGKLYLWESTQSGALNDGVNNIYGEAFAGVQVCYLMCGHCGFGSPTSE
jgi:hypothetical protein